MLVWRQWGGGRGRYPDGGRAELDGFEGVLDLEEAALGGEGAGGVSWGEMELGGWAYLIPRSGGC